MRLNSWTGGKLNANLIRLVLRQKLTLISRFPCPYLSSEVELSSEREKHIAEHHPDLLPEYRDCIAETLLKPDQIRLSARLKNARLFTRWFDFVRGGKYIVVVVISESKFSKRHWIVTSYMARKLAGSEIEWNKD